MSKPTPVTLDHTVSKSDNFVESQVDGETILMHLDEGNFSSLKSTGLRIWAMLETPQKVSGICSSLQEEFEVDASTCEHQTIAFLQGLSDQGLIEVRD